MSGKLLPILIIIIFAVVIGVSVFIFIPKDKPDPNDNNTVGALENLDEPPAFSVSQEVNEEEGVVVVTTDTSESPVEVNKIALLNTSDKIIEEYKGADASFNISENGKYKVTAYATNGRVRSKTINVTDVPEKRKSNPYVPDGFKVLKSRNGEISPDDGYVIVDDNNNQYVWVPVESGNLTRNTAYEADYEDDASELPILPIPYDEAELISQAKVRAAIEAS